MISQRGLNIIGFVTLVLVVVNMFLLVGNQSLQRIVAERQQVIMRSIQMQGPAREVITAKLADEGNPNAQRIAAEFKKRGFKAIGAAKPVAAPPK